MTTRVAPGGLIHTGGSVVDTLSSATPRDSPGDVSFPLLVLSGHAEAVCATAWSKDGKKALTGSEDKTAKIFDAQTGHCLHTLVGHEGQILGLAISPDGTRLVTASGDRTARVWNPNNGSCLRILEGHTGQVFSGYFSPGCR